MRPKTIYVYKDFGNDEKSSFLLNASPDFLNKLDERRIYCKKCGHSMYMNYKVHELICSHCGCKVKKEGKIFFKDKMRELLNEEIYNDKRRN